MVYRSLRLDPPPFLQQSFITTRAAPFLDRAPSGDVIPTLDGLVAPEDEWAHAGRYRAPQAGSMARGGAGIRALRFGMGGECLYVLVETAGPVTSLLAAGEVRVDFGAPPALRYRLVARDGGTSVQCERLREEWQAHPTAAVAVAADVLEVAIPWPELLAARTPVAFSVAVWQAGVELERHPDGARIEVRGGQGSRGERDRG